MKDWDLKNYEEESVRSVHRNKHFNKERFCKKNKLGGGSYGPHIYNERNHCNLCNKINPKLKFQNYKEEENND